MKWKCLFLAESDARKKGLKYPRYDAGHPSFLRKHRRAQNREKNRRWPKGERNSNFFRPRFASVLFFCATYCCEWWMYTSEFYRRGYWLYTREREKDPWCGMRKVDEWRFSYEMEISFVILLEPEHQHTCTYFCWHYVKWWIISRHEGYIFYSLLSE